METRMQPDAAAAALAALAVEPEQESAALMSALFRISAEEIRATLALPPFARSAYDGFALESRAVAHAAADRPARLTIAGELPAGSSMQRGLAEGTAVRIMTGAPVPPGADAVVPKERVEQAGDTIWLTAPLTAGENIAPPGEDVALGETLVHRGERLLPATLGLIAGQGRDRARVYAQPRITLLSTGSELVAAGEARADAKIYNTNLYSVGGCLTMLGAKLEDGGIVRDDVHTVAAAIEDALKASDAVFLTGGASVGDYDYTLRAMEKLGGRVLFWKTAMKPGGAMLAAEIDGKAVVGLSGNPGAALMGLLRVAAPFVKKLCGRSELDWRRLRLPMLQGFDKPSPQMRLLRGRLVIEDGQAAFEPLGRQHNGAVSSFVDCDLVAEIPAGSPALPAGTPVTVYRIEW